MQIKRIVLVHQPTLGLRHDAKVLAKALTPVFADAEFYSLEIPYTESRDRDRSFEVPDWLREKMPYTFAFFFEHLAPVKLLSDPQFSERRIFIPNVEWLLRRDEREMVRCHLDAILYKNAQSAAIIEELPCTRAIPVRTVSGWTSLDIADPCGTERPSEEFERFIHVRGVSVQKQTDIVIETWLQNPDFPSLTVLANTRDEFSVSVPLRAAPNLEIILQRLDTSRFRNLQRHHGVHIAPSSAEGFGHSLNEARACGALLITTDGPPMADFVSVGTSGFLVPVRPEDIRPHRRSHAYPVRPAELAATVRKVLAMPLEERRRMGASARELYCRDRRAFERTISTLFGPGGVLA